MVKNLLQISSLLLLFTIGCFSSVSAQTWSPVSDTPDGFVTDHSYGFSLDGLGYLVTGTNELGNATKDFYQYDPVSDEFTQLPDFPGTARGFAIGDTWDGKAYFGFGSSNTGTLRNDLWEFDPTTQTWTQLAICPCAARRHPAMVAHNGKVYVGLGSSSSNLNDWWIYDIASNSWTQGAQFPSVVRHHPYQFGIGDYIYAGLGHGASIYNDWYRYDPATDTWDEMAPLPGEGRVAGQQLSYNGKGYILSGEGMDHSAMDEGEFWEYTPEDNSWAAMPSHPGTSRWAPASFVLDGEAYLFNGIVYGFGPAVSMQTGFKFTFEENVMSSAPSLVNNSLLNVYPNPASSFLTLEFSGSDAFDGDLIITDILGHEQMRFAFDHKQLLDIQSLANGVYFLTATDGSVAKQFVVARK